MEKSIYLKTLKLFGIKGTRFTTEDLAKELGTSKRTIYMYFASKDEIIERTIDYIFEEIIIADSLILENRNLTVPEKIIQCFESIPDAYNLGSIIRHMDDLQRYYPFLWGKVIGHLDTIWDALIQLVEQGIKNKEIEAIDTVILKLMLNESFKKLLDYEYIAKNHMSFDSGLKAMRNIILYGLFKRESN